MEDMMSESCAKEEKKNFVTVEKKERSFDSLFLFWKAIAGAEIFP